MTAGARPAPAAAAPDAAASDAAPDAAVSDAAPDAAASDAAPDAAVSDAAPDAAAGRALSVAPPRSPWFVYLLECADGSLYAGVARDIARRLRQHNGQLAGGAKYTSGRRPVTLHWLEVQPSRGAAQRREAEVRKLPRGRKLALRHAGRQPTATGWAGGG